jgi:hypothetical protein
VASSFSCVFPSRSTVIGGPPDFSWTTWAAAYLLRAWIERYGVTRALYTDWKNVYVRTANAQERLREKPQSPRSDKWFPQVSAALVLFSEQG